MSGPYAIFDKLKQIMTFSTPMILQLPSVIRADNTDNATTPSYTWNDDSNTGMYHGAQREIAFCTNGFERMRIATPNIGIGTANPQSLFHVQGSSNSVYISSTGCNVGIGTLPSSYALHVMRPSLLLPPIMVFEERYVYNCNVQVLGQKGWRLRNLNFTNYTTDSFANFQDSFITLSPGTYYIQGDGSCSGSPVTYVTHKTGFSNRTNEVMAILGTCQTSGINVPNKVRADQYTSISVAFTTSTAFITPISTNSYATSALFSTSTFAGIQTINTTTRYGMYHYTSEDENIDNKHFFGFSALTDSGSNVLARVVITKYQ